MAGPNQAEKTEDRWLDQFKSKTIAPSVQVVIAWDGATLRVEAPATNGAARDKIEGISLSDLPYELQVHLTDALAKLKRQPTTSTPKAEFRDIQGERLEAARQAGAERRRRHMEWIDSLPEDRKAFELKKLEDAAEKIREQEAARARQIWLMTATNHDMNLANRVITDPARRPARKVIVATANGPKEVSPRRYGSEVEETKKKPAKKIDPRLATDLSKLL